MVFQLTQHSRDKELLRSLVNYIGSGNYFTPKVFRQIGEVFIITSNNEKPPFENLLFSSRKKKSWGEIEENFG